MPKITIDEIEYHTEDLTENGRAQLASCSFWKGRCRKSDKKLPCIKPRKRLYAQALKAEIAKAGLQPLQSETPPSNG